MGHKKEIVERLNILQKEAGLSKPEFKKNLVEITGKTPRTLRRWFALETIIQDEDLKKIAVHFGHHENWLKYGENYNREFLVDQIMMSNHFGVVVMKGDVTESMNYKFIDMMGIRHKNLKEEECCKYILSFQPEETVGLCEISTQLAQQQGSHHQTMIMIMGDQKKHSVEVTILNINNDRVLIIIVDKGLVS